MITEQIRQTIDPMTFLGMEATSKVGLDRIFMIVSEYLGIAPDDMSRKTCSTHSMSLMLPKIACRL